MNFPTNPLTIEIAMWYHCRAVDYGALDHNFFAPAVKEAFTRLVAAGLLKCNDRLQPNYDSGDNQNSYSPTDGLKVYIEALLQVPFPVQRWAMPTEYEAVL